MDESIEQREVAMESMVQPTEATIVSSMSTRIRERSCAHGRMIDDVLTRFGTRAGKVRCLECLAIIDDPHQGTK